MTRSGPCAMTSRIDLGERVTRLEVRIEAGGQQQAGAGVGTSTQPMV